ncbi:Txe/YoeB family addiction module toxin [Pasteurella skyensis]|uniref:Putative mRNA interferase YoeB n=1 Tax=Phocoenobacter skyensis TaxID=97481 RepID=A0AAJ6NBU1_9PAST|nr:Txe/YoeB family addiction module toxin [Pasteurella skyensis]MDP8169769.1 Txe/YoeB family addiction module toxin [Pasteurella skyensis]MDP8173906.1 Txe/YoeB family addiction module toxin [Pasteurella skyensis]
MYSIEYSNKVEEDIYKHKKHGNKKLLKKINQFINELEQHPHSGTGQVERLKHYAEREIYSRRIDKEHRLVYEIIDDKVIVILISAFGHY